MKGRARPVMSLVFANALDRARLRRPVRHWLSLYAWTGALLN
jgi:hypothetical protein